MKKLVAPATVLALTASLCCILTPVRCETLLVPSQLHVGENNTILLISESDSTANLALYEKGNNVPVLSQPVRFRQGELVEWTLLLDSKIAYKDKVSIVITFNNGAKSVEEFEVSPTNGFVFFQTDKPIYRVSQTVRFRVLRLSRSLSPINEKVLLKIQNHQTIKVDEVTLYTEPPYHIAEYSFSFPLIAKPGKWSAELLYGPNHKLRQNTFFEVTEYVLPLFKIEILTPKFVFDEVNKVAIAVKVHYTYGKPANGTLHFQYGIEDSHGYKRQATSTTYCFKDGLFNQTVPINFLSGMAQMGPVRFRVEAIVRECASGTIQSAENSDMMVVRRPYSISQRKTIRMYKSMVNNYLTFEVVDPHNSPVADVPLQLNMTGSDGSHTIQLDPYVVSIDTTNGIKTDKNGQVVLLFKTRTSNLVLNLQITTIDPRYRRDQQTSDSITIKPFTTKEEDIVWIENRKQLTTVAGSRFESKIEKRGNLRSFYLVVMSKGSLIHHEKLSSDSPKIDLALTNRMVPSVRLLVLAFTDDGAKYVADSLRLEVQQGDCGVSVDLHPELNKFQSGADNSVFPGQPVTFSIKGDQGDVVGVQGIDEAVYVLRSEKNSSYSRYTDSLRLSDSGCGPGEGTSSLQVIRSAGFKVLSPNSDNIFSDNYCQEYRKKSRVTRSPYGAPKMKYTLEQCCQLAKVKTRSNKGGCESRRNKVYQHTHDNDCAKRFFECCKETKTGPKIQFSAPKNSSAITNHKEESTTKTEVKIKNEEPQTVDTSLVRHDFRDTWLFDLVLLNDSREVAFTRATPHSITSWVISTLALSQRNGFCMNEPLKVITFKPFFIEVSFPPIMVQHEQAEVGITVFNYNTERHLNVGLSFAKVANICTDNGANRKPTEYFTMSEMSTVRHSFPVVPLLPGVYPIKIQATSIQIREFTDTVIKNLTVVAPGIEKEKQLTFDLDPLNRAKRDTRVASDYFVDETITSGSSGLQKTKVNLKVDKNNQLIASGLNIVPKTLHYIVTAVGERFNPQIDSIEELGKLIKKPKGCGEQNMYYMSFNLYTLMYLEKIGKLSNQMREKGVLYLKRALAQQLNFRKDDGSYSAFFKRPSSIWLTAFVVKVMCQSHHFVGHELDATIIDSALHWLQQLQNSDGNWKEIQVILHEKALGGVNGTIPLTAYIALAFSECRTFLQDNKLNTSNVDGTIKKANTFLTKNLNDRVLRNMEPFSQSLVAYSLSRSASNDAKLSDLKQTLIELLLKSPAIHKDKARNLQYWMSEFPIETASYALMAIINSDPEILNYIAIVNWLSTQQKRGAFDNTQDTIVALEALAKYYGMYKEGEDDQVRLFTNVTYNSRLKRSLYFDNTNADVLQTIEVDKDTKEIAFLTSGNGLGKVNVHIIYNEYSEEDTCNYFLEIDVYPFKDNSPPKAVAEDVSQNNLDVFSDELITDIGVHKDDIAKTNNKIPSPQANLPNCCSTRLVKRSIFTGATLFSYFSSGRPTRSKGPGQTNSSHWKRSEPSRQADQARPKFEFGPLPYLNDPNPIILVLNICVRHLQKDSNSNEMAILEVSILSGFKPIEEDLKDMLKDSSYIAHYDISNAKVTIYFHTVPYGRLFCPYFRIHQEYRVNKIQSALVRIYNYYREDWTCTRLYSDLGISKNIDIKCDESEQQACKCVSAGKCPESNSLKEILKVEVFETRRRKFKDLVCQYSRVVRGRLMNATSDNKLAKLINNAYKTPIVRIDVLDTIQGVAIKNLFIRLNPECAEYIKDGSISDVAILHTPQEDDMWNEKESTATWLVEGNSIFMPLDNYFRKRFESVNHFSREDICTLS